MKKNKRICWLAFFIFIINVFGSFSSVIGEVREEPEKSAEVYFGAPVVSNLQEGDTVLCKEMKVKWEEVEGAWGYRFILKNISRNKQIINDSSSKPYYYVYKDELESGKDYRIEVGAIDSNGNERWTEINFSVEFQESDSKEYPWIPKEEGQKGESVKVFSYHVLNVESTSATLYGEIVNNGDEKIYDCGFYWGKNKYGHMDKESLGSKKGGYLYDEVFLEPGKIYYYRAYALTQKGEIKGDLQSFTTPMNVKHIPIMVTYNPLDLEATGAKLYGEILKDGGAKIYDCGFYWGSDVDHMNNKESLGYYSEGEGEIYAQIYIQPGKTYFYQTYAVNSEGMNKGNIYSFTTPKIMDKPQVVTYDALNIDDIWITLYGEIVKDGGDTIRECGFYWGEDISDLYNRKARAYFGEDDMSIYARVFLEPGKTYYYQAYGRNNKGEGRGEIYRFTAPDRVK